MQYRYSALLGKIVEIFGTQGRFASALGVSERTLSLRLNNKLQWRQDEILRASELLNISAEDIPRYFFTPEVQNI